MSEYKKGIDISVIMPVYNCEKHIGEAIGSILQQSFDNFEFIIINDASTDATASVIDTYQDKRITVIHNANNLGNYPSRNIGLQQASGKYICVMDADDVASPKRLELQYLYMESNLQILASGSWYSFPASDIIVESPVSNSDILVALLDNNCFLHPSLIIRTDVMQSLGGYNEKYIYSSDYDLLCRLVLLGEIANYPVTLMMHRLHKSQISQGHFIEQTTYVNEIRINYQTAIVEKYKRADQQLLDKVAVKHPNIGRVICLYTYALSESNEKYEEQAHKLLDEVIEAPIELISGSSELYHSALGCGLIYLLRNGFVEGDESEILSEIDQRLSFLSISWEKNQKEALYAWIHYLQLRISSECEKTDCLIDLINRQNLICFFDQLEKTDFFLPNCLLIDDLEKINKMRLYPEKTGKLLADYNEVRPVTFVIPVRIDSAERENNLDTLLTFLSAKKNAQILILEADKKQCYHLKVAYPNVNYKFVEDTDPIFHRTKYLNDLLRAAKTRIVGVWDTDVIISEDQMDKAIEEIWIEKAVMSFPYDGTFYMLSSNDSALFRTSSELSFLSSCIDRVNMCVKNSVGGAFFVSKEVYLNAGGENEHFYGWGAEDLERVRRMEILGLPVFRSGGPLFHLYHPRISNSWYGSQKLEIQSRTEFLKICSLTRDELLQYIQTFIKS